MYVLTVHREAADSICMLLLQCLEPLHLRFVCCCLVTFGVHLDEHQRSVWPLQSLTSTSQHSAAVVQCRWPLLCAVDGGRHEIVFELLAYGVECNHFHCVRLPVSATSKASLLPCPATGFCRTYTYPSRTRTGAVMQHCHCKA